MNPLVSPPPAPDPDRAKTAGRGGVAVLGAKLFFLVVGFVQQPLLRLRRRAWATSAASRRRWSWRTW